MSTKIIDVHRAKEKRFIDEANRPIKRIRLALILGAILLLIAKIFFF